MKKLLLFAILASAARAVTVTLTWDDNSSGETGFQIERVIAPSAIFVVVATVVANTTSFVDAPPEGTTQASYRVKAKADPASGRTDSAYSNIAVWVKAPEPTMAPTAPPSGALPAPGMLVAKTTPGS